VRVIPGMIQLVATTFLIAIAIDATVF
jgi:hypothetical protein